MDLVNAEARGRLSRLIEASLHDGTIGLEAEAFLSEAFDAPDQALLLLAIADCLIDIDEVRVSAAARFKEIVHCRWPRHDDSKDHLPYAECSFIKERILPILRRARGPVQSEVAEAIMAIATHDFPSRWTDILPYIAFSLQAACSGAINQWDLEDIRSLLLGASSVISCLSSRFSNSGDDDMGVCHPDLEYCVDKFLDPLKSLTSQLQDVLLNSVHPPQHSLSCLVLCYHIFSHLNISQMHVLFKNDLQIWISNFKSILNANIALEDVDALYAAACANLQVCVVQHGADPMVDGTDFARLLQVILNNKSSSKKLIETALNSLCKVVRSQTLRSAVVVDSHSVIELCRNFIMPHLILRDDDEMMFTHDWENFDSMGLEERDGLRRSACDLLEEIVVFQQRSLCPQVLDLIIMPALLAYEGDPANQWKTKDAALRFFIALSRMPDDMSVSMEDFIVQHIEPDLDRHEWESLPLLMAGELRFLVLFKDKLTSSTTLRLFTKVVKFLLHGSAAVRFHAATYIKQCVSQNLPIVPGGNNIVETVVQNILRALQFPDPGGHPYLLKCLIAVLAMVNGRDVLHISQKLLSILNRMYNQPRHEDFNYYLFEALSSTFGEITKKCTSEEALSAARAISDTLSTKIILNKNLLDLWHYSFQVLAQIIDSIPLNENDLIYMSEIVLDNATQSDRKECRPAMIRLLRAALKKIPNILYQEDKLQRTLAISESLLKTSTSYDSAFGVLNVLVEMDSDLVMRPHIPSIFTVLLSLLDEWMQREEKVNVATFYRKACVVFTSLVILRYGLECTVTSIGEATERAGLVEGSTAGVQRSNEWCFLFFTRCYWSADFCLVKEESEVKVTAAAFSLFLKGHKPIRADPMWCGESLNRILAMIFTIYQSGGADDKDTLWLSCTRAADNDLLPDMDPKMLLLESLIQFRQMKPDILHRAMMCLIPDKRDALLQFAADHNAIID